MNLLSSSSHSQRVLSLPSIPVLLRRRHLRDADYKPCTSGCLFSILTKGASNQMHANVLKGTYPCFLALLSTGRLLRSLFSASRNSNRPGKQEDNQSTQTAWRASNQETRTWPVHRAPSTHPSQHQHPHPQQHRHHKYQNHNNSNNRPRYHGEGKLSTTDTSTTLMRITRRRVGVLRREAMMAIAL